MPRASTPAFFFLLWLNRLRTELKLHYFFLLPLFLSCCAEPRRHQQLRSLTLAMVPLLIPLPAINKVSLPCRSD